MGNSKNSALTNNVIDKYFDENFTECRRNMFIDFCKKFNVKEVWTSLKEDIFSKTHFNDEGYLYVYASNDDLPKIFPGEFELIFLPINSFHKLYPNKKFSVVLHSIDDLTDEITNILNSNYTKLYDDNDVHTDCKDYHELFKTRRLHLRDLV